MRKLPKISKERQQQEAHRLDGSLLNGRGLFEAVGVDAAEQVLAETHRVKSWDDLEDTKRSRLKESTTL